MSISPSQKLPKSDTHTDEQLPSFHLKCRLCFHTMPMGNRMPMVLPPGMASSHLQQHSSAAAKGDDIMIVDAHSIQGVTMEQAVVGVSKAMFKAMDHEELLLRRQISHKVVLSMGRMMTHFEGDVNPYTGVLEVDHVFKPLILSKEDEHMAAQHGYDPLNAEMKVKDCIVMRTYCTHVDPETKEVYSYPIAHETIDLGRLLERSIEVSEKCKHMPPQTQQPARSVLMHTGDRAPSSSQVILDFTDHSHQQHPAAIAKAQQSVAPQTAQDIPSICEDINEHSFALNSNFCNTFVLASVLPIWGEVQMTGAPGSNVGLNSHSNDRAGATVRMEIQPGLLMVHEHEEKHMQAVIAKMRSELDRLTTGVQAYVAERDAKLKQAATTPSGSSSDAVNLAQHMFMQSTLRNIHYTQKVVKLQQALQQAYCMHGVETANMVLSEPNSMQFASGATCLQLHRASVTFPMMTQIHNMRAPPIPRHQLMVQFYAAMVKTGLKPQDLLKMRAHSHANAIAELLNTVISSSELDQNQAGYKYDYVIHSVMPVEEHIALANLKPVPGMIQYAPGCQDCFYKLHTLYSPSAGKEVLQWYR